MDSLDDAVKQLRAKLPGKVWLPGEPAYEKARSIWARPRQVPRIIVQCAEPGDVQVAILAAGSRWPISVKGGGHDWAARSLCEGLVIDLSAMRRVEIARDQRTVRVGGGALAADLFAFTDRWGLAAVTGSVSLVGLAGLTLGGGYGPLNARFGLACDNLISAEVVLADGTIVRAAEGQNDELFWALRGGGGNFGVVTEMTLKLHIVPRVRSGIILYPLEEARAVFADVAEICASAPDPLSVQVGMIPGPEGASFVAVVPTWSGAAALGEQQLAPLQRLGNVLMSELREQRYGESRSIFNPYIVNGRRTFMETRWLRKLDDQAVNILIDQIKRRPSAFCSVLTHEFRGAAARVPPNATAFGMREPHVLIEILAQVNGEGRAEEAWVRETSEWLAPFAFPGGYAHFLPESASLRARASYGPNAARLLAAKRRFDPNHLFKSAITLPPE